MEHTLRKASAALTILLLATAGTASAQSAAAFRDEFLRQFDNSMGKFVSLAEATPAERFTWGPTPEVMPVGQVFMHVARYNYLYPSSNMGASLPAGVDLSKMEAERQKERVVAALRASAQYVRAQASVLTEEQLSKPTRLYGRDVPQWAVLFQLLAHMNEHLGQSIAYARGHGLVPPWSR